MTDGAAIAWMIIVFGATFTSMIWTLIIAKVPSDLGLLVLTTLISITITFAITIPVLS